MTQTSTDYACSNKAKSSPIWSKTWGSILHRGRGKQSEVTIVQIRIQRTRFGLDPCGKLSKFAEKLGSELVSPFNWVMTQQVLHNATQY